PSTHRPGPRTGRHRRPRFTVSAQTAARSTSSAAGSNRITENATTATATTPQPARINCRRIFFFLISGLEISIAARTGATARPLSTTHFQPVSRCWARGIVHNRKKLSILEHLISEQLFRGRDLEER